MGLLQLKLYRMLEKHEGRYVETGAGACLTAESE